MGALFSVVRARRLAHLLPPDIQQEVARHAMTAFLRDRSHRGVAELMRIVAGSPFMADCLRRSGIVERLRDEALERVCANKVTMVVCVTLPNTKHPACHSFTSIAQLLDYMPPMASEESIVVAIGPKCATCEIHRPGGTKVITTFPPSHSGTRQALGAIADQLLASRRLRNGHFYVLSCGDTRPVMEFLCCTLAMSSYPLRVK